MDTWLQRVTWGPEGTRKVTSAKAHNAPFQWAKESWGQCTFCGRRGRWIGASACAHCLKKHGSWQTIVPTTQRVFCGSMLDWAEDRPDLVEPRRDLFAVINRTPTLRWLMLTKRPQLIRTLTGQAISGNFDAWLSVHPEVWWGISCETQNWYDKRMEQVKGGNIGPVFLSLEPLLGPIDLHLKYMRPLIRWVIIGGESGFKARAMEPQWAIDLIVQCHDYDVPVFFKQTGAVLATKWNLYANKGDEMSEWPEEFQVQEAAL